MNRHTLSRRRFLAAGAAATTAGLESLAHAYPIRSANEKLNIAMVGVGQGGVGGVLNLPRMARENIVAICDIDEQYAGPNFEKYPKAKRWTDFRRMLDRQKDIDAVVVSTPDHSHAVIAVTAMRHGKHVYCEKPLARCIGEVRRMREVARQTKVATQMGNHGTYEPSFRRAVEIIQSGAIGQVTQVHTWSDRPLSFWKQSVTRPKDTPRVPAHLDWDLFLGPAPLRPYHPIYHPFTWRGWWDFGTGVLGDIICHTVNMAYLALDLQYPTRISTRSEGLMAETAPKWAEMVFEFPARGKQPPVTVTWYEAGRKPPLALALGEPLPGNGALLIGDKGRLLQTDMYGAYHKLLPTDRYSDYTPPAQTLPRARIGHQQEWIDSAKTGSPTMANFEYAGRLTEAFLVGNVALRTGQTLQWDGEAMQATNCPEAQRFVHPEYRKGWSLD
jgi:predicted dehydrogenase